jgi:hypothetical protein
MRKFKRKGGTKRLPTLNSGKTVRAGKNMQQEKQREICNSTTLKI